LIVRANRGVDRQFARIDNDLSKEHKGTLMAKGPAELPTAESINVSPSSAIVSIGMNPDFGIPGFCAEAPGPG